MFRFNINMYAVNENFKQLLKFNLGNDEMVKGFFTNIAYHLENKKWGSVYPTIMNEFYSGKIEQKDINNAIKEIKEIKQRLSEIDFSQIVFSMESVPEKKYLKEEENIISIDDMFINNNRQKMTDMILMVLESVKNSKNPLYIGKYYYKELCDKKLLNTIKSRKNNQKRNTIIKYIIYLIMVLIVKFAFPEQQFNGFIMIFILSVIVAESIFFYYKKNKNNIKDSKNQQEIEYKYFPEPITLERNLMSSRFDRILDEIECPKTFNDILTTLKAKKIENWKSDMEKIHSDLGYSSEYIKIIIENFEYSSKEFDTFEYYQIENIYKVIPKEKVEKIYDENDIYRIIKYNNHMTLIIFNNLKK